MGLSVQFSHSVVSDSATPWIAACQASLSITNSRSSLRLMSIESVMPSSHLLLCRPLLLLPPIPPSIRVFSNESTLRMRWPEYWGFSFSIIPSKEIPGLISFRMDWLDLLAVQGTLKSLLQHHSSKALALSFLHSPTLTSIHDHWKNHSLVQIYFLHCWCDISSRSISKSRVIVSKDKHICGFVRYYHIFFNRHRILCIPTSNIEAHLFPECNKVYFCWTWTVCRQWRWAPSFYQ